MQEYLDAIRRKVCLVCIDGIFEHKQKFVRCGLPKNRTCPVEHYLPEVVEVVESISSPKIDDYVTVLREKVCEHCEQTDEGICDLRLKADCALDRYFMLVAGAIEEVRGTQQAGFSNENPEESLNNPSDDLLSPTPW